MVRISKINTWGWLLAISMCFLGCEEKRTATFVFKQTKLIAYDGNYVKPGWFSKIKQQPFKGVESLISFDNNNLILYFHDVTSLHQYHKINISPKCLEVLGQTFRFYIDDDFIYLLGYPNSKIAKLDLKGNMVTVYELPRQNYPAESNCLSELYGAGFTNFNENFLLYAQKYGQDNALKKIQNECAVHFKLKDSDSSISIVDHSGWFPQNYSINQIVLCSKPFIALGDNHQLIYAFAPDKNLYIYDTSLVLKTAECPKSIYETPNDTFDMSKYGIDWEHHLAYNNKASYYAGIFYDKYRQLYYRVYAHGRNKNDPPQDHKLENYNRHFSIIIMDKNFKKLGEQKFERNKYYFFNILPTPQGLLLPKIEANFDEPAATAEFDLFEVVEATPKF